MPEREKGLNQPASGGSEKAPNASTAAPDGKQTADDADESPSCCGSSMRRMFNTCCVSSPRATAGGQV